MHFHYHARNGTTGLRSYHVFVGPYAFLIPTILSVSSSPTAVTYKVVPSGYVLSSGTLHS